MQKLLLKEFALHVNAYFPRPILKAKSAIGEIAEDLLAIPNMTSLLTPESIRLTSEDDIFRYALQASILNGLVTVRINSQHFSLGYLRGAERKNLAAVVDLFEKMFIACGKNPFSTCEVIANLHSTFEEEDGLAVFSKKFTDLALRITSGGLILSGDGVDFEGAAKLTLEPSMLLPGGLFTSAVGTTKQSFTSALFTSMEKRFLTLLEKLNFELTFAL
jgi:hypothetical protein